MTKTLKELREEVWVKDGGILSIRGEIYCAQTQKEIIACQFFYKEKSKK